MAETKEEPKVELTKDELKIIVNILAQASVRVSDAPVVIGIVNKVSQMIDKK